MKVKQLLLRVFFGAELLVFAGIYMFGPHGVKCLWHMKQENKQLEVEVAVLGTEIAVLEQKIVQWNTNPFYKEKFAREQLQMAKKDELIYYFS